MAENKLADMSTEFAIQILKLNTALLQKIKRPPRWAFLLFEYFSRELKGAAALTCHRHVRAAKTCFSLSEPAQGMNFLREWTRKAFCAC